MNIYSRDEQDFTRNGYGFLSDCLTSYVTEVLNGDYVLDFTYPINGKLSDYIVEENIIKCNVGNNSYQLFRIKKVVKTFTTITVKAYHIFYDLLDNFIVDASPTNLNCASFGQWILDRTNFENKFVFLSDITNVASARYVRKNPVEAIMGDIDNSMLNRFGGDITRDNFTIRLDARRGNDNHVKLLFGKNITDIKVNIDITQLYTRIMPIGFDGLLLPEKFVDSPLINNYITPKITTVEYGDVKYDPTGEDEEAYTNIEDAYTDLRNKVRELYINGTDKPSISIKINWLELSKTEQYKHQYQALETVHLGDTITANVLGLDYKTRITKTKYNVLNDMVEQFEIGTISKTIANTLNAQNMAINEISPSSIVEQAKNGVSGLIKNAMGGYVYKTNSELYIMDTDNPTTAQNVWRWNINGLGFSSNGINGEYETAMTMDGQIVADMITTGKINTTLIEGYGSLVSNVKTLEDTSLSKEEFDDYKTTAQTSFVQKSDSFDFIFEKFESKVNDIVQEGIDNNNTEIQKYIRFDNGNVFLGATNSKVIAVLTTEGLFFCPKGTNSDFKNNSIAYFTDTDMAINDATVFDNIKIGKFAFTPRNNGSLSFGKVE